VTPLISIVVPNFNGKHLLKECLDSIKNLHYDNYEVIVVDNSSTDGSGEMVMKQYPWAKLLVTEKIRIGQACNRGMRLAEGDVIVTMLNNDMTVDRHWLDHLIVPFRKKKVGIVGGKIHKYGSNLILSAGAMIDWDKGITFQVGRGEIDEGQFDKLREVDYVDVPTVKRDVMHAIGGIDEEYEHYYVDADYCIRAKRAGYKTVYVPRAVSWHRESSTIGAGTRRQYYCYYADGIRFMIKYSTKRKTLGWIYHNVLMPNYLRVRRRERADLVGLSTKAMLWNLTKLYQTSKSGCYPQNSDQSCIES